MDNELRLKINAAAAKAGAKEFVAAIGSIKKAVNDLDRVTAKSFDDFGPDTKKVSVAKDETERFSKSAKTAADAVRKMALASASAFRTSADQATTLTKRLNAIGDTAGIAKVNEELVKLQRNLVEAQSPLDVRSARSGFADITSEVRRNAVALEEEARSAKVAATAAAQHEASLDSLRAKYNPLYAASKQYETALQEIARAEKAGVLSANLASNARANAAKVMQAGGVQMRDYGNAMRVAGHQAQNAAFQLQDVFVTAEMGMSPMRIALQQGTQLSMVMHDMVRTGGGAKGAISGLAAGIGSMINPVSLLTIGLVAGGAALIQWAFSALDAGEETRDFGTAIGDVNSAINGLSTSTDTFVNASLGGMAEGYGRVTAELVEHLARLREIEQIKAFNGIKESLRAIEDQIVGGFNLTTAVDEVRIAFDTTNDRARDLLRMMDEIQNAQTFEQQLAAITRMREAVESSTGGLARNSEAANNVLINLIQAEDAALRLQTAQEGSAETADRLAQATSGVSDAAVRAHQAYARFRTESNAAQASAQQILADLRQQATMAQAIAEHGEDSAQVTALRASLERENFAQMVNSLDVAESLKAEMFAAFDAKQLFANTDIVGGISSAASEAERLASALGIALSTAVQLSISTPAMRDEDAVMSQSVLPDAQQREQNRRALANFNRLTAPSPSRGGGGGGRSSGGGGGSRTAQLTDEQRAVESLTDSLNDRVTSLDEERRALALVTAGTFANREAADLYAEAQTVMGGTVDETTAALIAQIDAATTLNAELAELARNPAQAFADSVGSWVSAGNDIQEGVIGNLRDGIRGLMTGEGSIEQLGESILGTVANVMADRATAELLDLFNLTGQDAPTLGQALGGAMGEETDAAQLQAGSEVAAQSIQTALQTGGQSVGQSITAALQSGGQAAASQMGSQVQTAGTTAGAQMGAQTATAGAVAGTSMMTSTQAGGTVAATQIQSAMVAGGQAAASQIGATSAGGGGGGLFGGGFGGILLGAGLSLASSLLNKSSSNDSSPSEPITPIGVRQFAEGTANTSGIPAILHPNEAVIPLSKGRKVPVDMGESAGGVTKIFNQTMNISTPDADSFRKSQQQIAADAASSGQRALSKNG